LIIQNRDPRVSFQTVEKCKLFPAGGLTPDCKGGGDYVYDFQKIWPDPVL